MYLFRNYWKFNCTVKAIVHCFLAQFSALEAFGNGFKADCFESCRVSGSFVRRSILYLCPVGRFSLVDPVYNCYPFRGQQLVSQVLTDT